MASKRNNAASYDRHTPSLPDISITRERIIPAFSYSDSSSFSHRPLLLGIGAAFDRTNRSIHNEAKETEVYDLSKGLKYPQEILPEAKSIPASALSSEKKRELSNPDALAQEEGIFDQCPDHRNALENCSREGIVHNAPQTHELCDDERQAASIVGGAAAQKQCCSRSKARRLGPLTPVQKANASFVRRHGGACIECKKRKVTVNISATPNTKSVHCD